MKSLLEYITEDIPKRNKDIHKEDISKRDKDIPKTDKDTNKEDMAKIDEDIPKIHKEDEDIPKEDIHKEDEDIHKEDIPKEDIINNENKVNENRVDDFKRAVSSIGFRKIKVYRF